MMKIAAVIFAVSRSAIFEVFQFKVPRAAAIMKDIPAPTAPACVGGKSPENNPPNTPNTNNNKVNNIEPNENDDKDDDVNMTDVVQHITHNDQDDDLVDFDSE